MKKLNKAIHFTESTIKSNYTKKELLNNFKWGYSIIEAVNDAKKNSYSYELEYLNNYRNILKNDTDLIDFSIFEDKIIPINEVYSKAASKTIWCNFYYYLTQNIKASNVLEIGTNLGVSGQFFLKAITENNQNNSFFLTMEGVSDLCKIARKRFNQISNHNNFDIIEGLYQNTFNEIKNYNKSFDLIFIDGNHKYKPTIEYYETLLNHSNENVIFIFDDINWSLEMSNAWKYLLNTNYSFSIDFYKMGIICIEKNNNAKKNYKMFLSF